jgi:hypothetical protein
MSEQNPVWEQHTHSGGIAHESFCNCVDRVENHELSDAGGTSLLSALSAAHVVADLPEPSSRAVPDSRLYSLPAAPRAGAIAGGDMMCEGNVKVEAVLSIAHF